VDKNERDSRDRQGQGNSIRRQFFVFNTGKNAIDEFNSYRYDPEKPKGEPIKENDHQIDAITETITVWRSLPGRGSMAMRSSLAITTGTRNLNFTD
jgi:hypothetical protein